MHNRSIRQNEMKELDITAIFREMYYEPADFAGGDFSFAAI